MEFEIRKLSYNLINDWLDFFDNEGFVDNEEWSGCYCMCYQWDEELQRKKEWSCEKEDVPYNRSCAISFISLGRMQGYLAYYNGKVVGWCNANDKKSYGKVNFNFPFEENEKDKRIKSIVCFCIAPDFRGKGVATQLLEKICEDAKQNGYDYVEAYPFINEENTSYHGPKSLYEKKGFVLEREFNDCYIVRKYLK